jgi:hypothetical protein
MSTRRIGSSSIGGGGGGSNVRYQTNETPGIVVGELWVDSDGTSSLVNSNDYLTKVDASATYALRTPYVSASPSILYDGQLWVDSDNNELYVYNGSAYVLAGGAGAKGGGNDKVFFENDIEITEDYEITTNKNAMTAGPITIGASATVTIPSGSMWTIV